MVQSRAEVFELFLHYSFIWNEPDPEPEVRSILTGTLNSRVGQSREDSHVYKRRGGGE